MAKVAYTHVDPDGHFTFHRADGSAVTVGHKPYETDDPYERSVLEECRFVKRAGKPAAEDA